MPTIRALIVDDEKPARERVRRLLQRDGRVEIAGVCAGGAEAIEAIRGAAQAGAPVHVMFLDVQMPELDGFGEYALRAFDAHAIAYLLKPFSDEKFQATLDHALRHVRAGHAEAMMAQLQALLQSSESKPLDAAPTVPRHVDRIVVRGSGRVRLLPVEQISWIEADGMYVKLHARDGATHLHRALLGSLDETLDPRRFVRIHRSAIVNIDVVVELRQDAHGDYVAVLRDRTEVRVGRRFRERLQARLGQQI
jgi:two-component system LytT family response regulator